MEGHRRQRALVFGPASYPYLSPTFPPLSDPSQLLQIPRLRPTEYSRIHHNERSVTRAYGGVLSAGAVRERIMRAFIIEEQRIVKKVLLDKQKEKAGKA